MKKNYSIANDTRNRICNFRTYESDVGEFNHFLVLAKPIIDVCNLPGRYMKTLNKNGKTTDDKYNIESLYWSIS